MIPSPLLISIALIWALAGIPVQGFPDAALLPAWLVAGATLGGVALLDWLILKKMPIPEVTRHSHEVWPVGHWAEVKLTLRHDQRWPMRMDVFDDYPADWEMQHMPQTCRIGAGQTQTLSYQLRPLERGNAQIGQCWLRLGSPLLLWQRRVRSGASSALRVFPDFAKLLGHTLQATDRRSPSAGSLRKRRRGEGTDFHQLREYRVGDSMRAIDWKATARMMKPISREYQEERDQQVLFLLDAGRRMLARDGDTSHFDHALNAMLTLAWVAQKQGDAVGVLTFGADERYLPPVKGRVGFDRILSGVYDLQPDETAPDYLQAAENLLSHLRKRAFIVLITNVRDEDDHSLSEAVALMSRHHLVMCASLRESVLDETRDHPVTNLTSALERAANELYLQNRRQAIRQLGIRAGGMVDVLPGQLSAALVDRYLDIKESGAL